MGSGSSVTGQSAPRGAQPLTFAVRVQVQDTAGPHHSLQGNDLVQRHPEQFIVIETAGWRMVGFVGPEIMVAEGEALLSEKGEREKVAARRARPEHARRRRGSGGPAARTSRSSRASRCGRCRACLC